jgi:hypothetical protein
MTDGTGLSPSLADLVAVGSDEAELLDWDLSALVDWPNIAPAPIFTAEPQAGGACPAH